MATIYNKYGITFSSNVVDVSKMRTMDLFCIAEYLLNNGEGLNNKTIAENLKKIGKTNIEIVNHPTYKFTLQAI